MRFDHQHAIITGGSSGIGKAIADILMREGAHVSLIARDPDKLAASKGELEALRTRPDQQVAVFSADVSFEEQTEQAIASAVAQSGPVDLLVTSAGITHPGYFMSVPIEVFERIMAVDYFGTL